MLFLYLMKADQSEKTAEIFPEKLVCESCGESFDCGAKIGECWCFNIEVGTENLENLKKDFKNCLCFNCLQKSEIKSVSIENLR